MGIIKNFIRAPFNFSQRITDHLINGILVFASVFLAFWLTDLREKKNTDLIVHNTLQSIADEMIQNQKAMIANYSYHIKFYQKIDSVRKSSPDLLNEINGYQIKGWEGLRIPLLRSSAFQMALTSGVVKDMPVKTFQAISTIYNSQSMIENLNQTLITAALTEKGFFTLENIGHIFGLYVEMQPELLSLYQNYGIPNLKEYGYSLELEEGNLKGHVERFNNLHKKK